MNMETPISAAREALPAERPSETAGERPRWQRYAMYAFPAALMAGGYGLVHRSTAAVAAPPPPNVSTAAPLVRDINE